MKYEKEEEKNCEKYRVFDRYFTFPFSFYFLCAFQYARARKLIASQNI